MRVAPPGRVLSSSMGFVALVVLGLALAGCPEKAGAPADKTSAEPERAEPDDGADDKARKPGAAAPAAADDEKKPDENKDEGGW